MPAPDLTAEITDIRDDVALNRDGSTHRTKRVTFYLGKFGPFTERFELDDFTDYSVKARLDTIRQTLTGIHA